MSCGRADEPDPAKSHALQSSLWELALLREHYCPTVSILSKAFELPPSAKSQVSVLPPASLCRAGAPPWHPRAHPA